MRQLEHCFQQQLLVPQQMIYLIKNPFKQRNKMTISNRRTNNSNSAYVRNEFEKQETTFRIKKAKTFRKEKKSYNTNSLQALKLSTHQSVNAAFQAACTEGGSIPKLRFSIPSSRGWAWINWCSIQHLPPQQPAQGRWRGEKYSVDLTELQFVTVQGQKNTIKSLLPPAFHTLSIYPLILVFCALLQYFGVRQNNTKRENSKACYFPFSQVKQPLQACLL